MTALAADPHPGLRRLREHPQDSAGAFLAALAMHAALVGWMWVAVQWRTNAAAPATAELWELPPMIAAPAIPAVPAPPVEAPPPPPSPEPVVPKPDIVQKQERPRRPAPSPSKEEPPRKTPRHAAQPSPAELRRQQEQAEKQHQDEMNRLTSQASSAPRARTAVTASSGPMSNEWQARIQSAVRAHLFFAVPEGVAPEVYAEFEVYLLPTGEQAAEPKLIKPSGVPGYDDAARRAIIRTDPFPRRDDGSIDRTLRLRMYPQDAR
jgi:colicin import membrane protein